MLRGGPSPAGEGLQWVAKRTLTPIKKAAHREAGPARDLDPSRLQTSPDRPQQGAVQHNDDQNAGIAIVRRALQAPIRQIAENAGVEGSIVVSKVLEDKSATFG
jgi:hypothetical protein